jgi:hypothetical protein
MGGSSLGGCLVTSSRGSWRRQSNGSCTQCKTQTFADYKTRGPVVLKPSDTAELIEKLEDSQMQLGSMATNR